MKRFLRDYAFLLVIAGVVVLLDQLSKAYIRNHLQLNEIWTPWVWLAPYARIVHWYNTGVAFGMFQGQGQIFSILNTIVAIAILYYFPRVPREEWALRVAMGLQLGGAVGNLIDRIMIGHVTDFISVGNFPVFNIADACITIGVGVLLLGMWLQERKNKQMKDSAAPENQPPTTGSHPGVQ